MKTSIFHFSELAAINDLAFANIPQNTPLLVQAYISGDSKLLTSYSIGHQADKHLYQAKAQGRNQVL